MRPEGVCYNIKSYIKDGLKILLIDEDVVFKETFRNV